MNLRQQKLDDRLRLSGIEVDATTLDGGRYLVPDEVGLVDGIDYKSPTREGRNLLPWAGRDGLVLTYRWAQSGRLSPKNGSCLERFLRIGRAPNEKAGSRVLAFARQWGPIEICEHSKPIRHESKERTYGECSRAFNSEPVEAWCRYSRQLEGILRVAANLLDEQAGEPADWQLVEAGEPEGIPTSEREYWGPASATVGNVHQERMDIALAVRKWLRYGKAGLEPSWGSRRALGDDRFELHVTTWGLVGRLALELVAALRSPGGIYRCAGCGNAFFADRKRAYDRERWCEDEGCLAERDRRNSKRYYARKKKNGGKR